MSINSYRSDEDEFIHDNDDYAIASIDPATGLYYYNDRDKFHNDAEKQQSKVNEKTEEIRKQVAARGLKEINGTIKQQDWAEKIRAEKISNMSDDEVSFFVKLLSARFWIENRDRSVSEFKELVKEWRTLNNEVRQILLNYHVQNERNPRYVTLTSEGAIKYTEANEKLLAVERNWKF